MTGPPGNSEFCFPRISMFPVSRISMFPETGNIEILGKQNSLFPKGPVIKCLLSNAKKKNNNKIIIEVTNLRFDIPL